MVSKHKIKENLDESTLNEFERRLSHRHYGLVFPEIRDSLKLVELPKSEEMNKVEEYNLHLASIEKIILLREILQYRKKIISISKTSSANPFLRSHSSATSHITYSTRPACISRLR